MLITILNLIKFFLMFYSLLFYVFILMIMQQMKLLGTIFKFIYEIFLNMILRRKYL